MEIARSTIELRAADGHALSAYASQPTGHAKAGLVVLQEIFGVNPHIRDVCDGYAQRGFSAIAPSLFDRVTPGTELAYDHDAIATGRVLRSTIATDDALLDVQAAIDAARRAGPVAVLGFCWGGTLAFLSATRLAGVDCAVGYYGAQTMPFVHEKVRVPLLLHFGERDPRIPPHDIETIRRHNPGIEMHTFPADHGFNCDQRKEWHRESAEDALRLTLAFFDRHLARARPAST